jgi:K+-sensing histidine kinase KdpD
MVLNQMIGAIGLQQENPKHVWTEEEIALAEAVANRAALALENARLLEEAQRRAVKEQTIGEISAKIGNLVNIENIVQTTIQELSQMIPGTEVAIQFQKN